MQLHLKIQSSLLLSMMNLRS